MRKASDMSARFKVAFSTLTIILITILLGFTVPTHALDGGYGTGGGKTGQTTQSTMTLSSKQTAQTAPEEEEKENWQKELTYEQEQWLLYTREKMRTPVSLTTLRVLAERASNMNLNVDDNTPVPMLNAKKSKNPNQRYGIFQMKNPTWSPMCVTVTQGTLCKDANKNGIADNKDIDTYTDFAAPQLDKLYYRAQTLKRRSTAPTSIMNALTDEQMMVLVADGTPKPGQFYSLDSTYLQEVKSMFEEYA